jgi:hypothetical protein
MKHVQFDNADKTPPRTTSGDVAPWTAAPPLSLDWRTATVLAAMVVA